jgi:hypothetical protein
MTKHRTIVAVEHDPEQSAIVSVEPTQSDQWFRVFTAVVDTGAWGRLTGAAKGVLIVLARYVNDARRRATGEMVAYPSVRTIAAAAGITTRGAQKALRELESAKLIRRGMQRDEGTFEYRMLVTKSDQANTMSSRGRTPVHPAPEPAFAPEANRRSPSPRTGIRQADEPEFVRNRRTQTNDSTSSAADALRMELTAEFIEAGINAAMCDRLVAGHSEQTLRRHLRDWQIRRQQGSKLGVAWLIASIQNGYELCEQTQREIDRETQASRAKAHRAAQLNKDAAEAKAQAELDRQATELFDSMSDEELSHWKSVVVTELPSMIRNPDSADPRTHARLKRLILGKLAHVVNPAMGARSV